VHIIVTNYGLLVFCPEKLSVTWWYVLGLWRSGSNSAKRCLDKIVRILLISLTVLIVSMFLSLYSVCMYFILY